MPFRGGGRVQGGRSGDAGFFRWAENADEILLNIVRPTFEAAAEVGYEVAFNNAAVRTGKMRDSIEYGTRLYKKRLEAYISVNVPYWQFVEYGTGLRGADSNPAGPVQAQGYHHGAVGGMPARPFMRPGLIAMAEAIKAGASAP